MTKSNNNIYEDLTYIVKRSKRAFIVVEVLFVLSTIIFWKIQILDHKKYWERSEANRKREIVIPAPRGRIMDREGTFLADNKASFKVSLIRENCEDFEKSCTKIADLLELEGDVLKQRIKKYESLPLFKPIVVKDNLDLEDIYPIEARKLELPELVLQAEPRRYYPFGNFAAHVLGYLQEISERELKRAIYRERRLGDLVGRTGIEKKYEDRLVGIDGRAVEIVDSLGRRKGEISREEPVKGHDLRLTLDFELQKKAEELLEGREGAVIVMGSQTGEILALASYPDFDPNRFINRFSPEEWLDLVNSRDYPLENRSIRGLYSPGSVFKLTMALAALDSGLIGEWKSFYCSGATRIYGHPFSCWFKGGHGAVNLYSGIEHSCNIYFYQLGKRLGIKKISSYAKMLGFGSKTGIDLLGEKQGLVPSPQWKSEVQKAPWYPGETISVSIGQGPLEVTPLQVAVHTALIANRGKRVTPYLIEPTDSPSRIERRPYSSLDVAIPVKSSCFEKVIEGMLRVVNRKGTGRGAKVEGYNVCGKTGSTQVVSARVVEKSKEKRKKFKTHSWFTGFAPKQNPEIIVTVLVEYGGMGGELAAPLARHLFELYRKKYD